ncbi:unnamed protein product [Natator depressus]
MMSNNLDWGQCVCTDSAAAMTGRHKGVAKKKITDVAPLAKVRHCMVHRENLAMRKRPDDLKDVLDKTIKVVNFIKTHQANAHILGAMCAEIGELHHSLLLNTEVRRLSKRKGLNRVFELRESLMGFLEEQMHRSGKFSETWLAQLAYLADIFHHLNQLNISMQGHQSNKVTAFTEKLGLWQKRVHKGTRIMSPCLQEFLNT